MYRKWSPHLLLRELDAGFSPGLPPIDVLNHAAQTLLAAVPADCWCAVLLDPSTFLDTGGEHRQGFPAHLMPRLLEIEHCERDYDNIRDLALRASPVAVLSASAQGRMHTSSRYRDVLLPAGYGDELRVLLRDEQRTWGVLVLCRGTDARHFTTDDSAAAALVSAPTAAALKRSLLLTGIDIEAAHGAPGSVILNADYEIVGASKTARRWLGHIAENHRASSHGTPYTLITVAVKAATGGGAAHARTRTTDGTWLHLEAWRHDHAGEPVTVVSVRPAQPGDLAPLVLAAYGLTERERSLVQMVLLGHSTREMARRAYLSEYTIQEYLQKIFKKVGVRTRGELTREVFFRYYFPHLNEDFVSTDGRMLDEDLTDRVEPPRRPS